ncbi:MAG: hypothetical protein P4L64_16075 [Caulobacteraceae bacterium]|nr:hypothetical protein [Caulobacteraceae bacterium]
MSDRIFLPVLALAALAMIALACVWPQGYGARSPAPFGYAPIQQTPEMQAAMARQAARNKAKHTGVKAAPAAAAGLRPTQ